MKPKALEILIVIVILFIIVLFVGCLIGVVGICIDRIKKLEEYHKPFDPNELILIDANSYEEFGNYEPPPEPNEPKLNAITKLAYTDEPKFLIWNKEIKKWEWKPLKYSLPIPTWPDYIELEKDLYIVTAESNTWFIWLNKGTKIYFKEDE